MVNFGPQLSAIAGFACWLRYCTDITERTSNKLSTTFGHLLGSCPPKGILLGAKFTCF